MGNLGSEGRVVGDDDALAKLGVLHQATTVGLTTGRVGEGRVVVPAGGSRIEDLVGVLAHD